MLYLFILKKSINFLPDLVTCHIYEPREVNKPFLLGFISLQMWGPSFCGDHNAVL